jgi:hypothetical protein
VLEGAERFPAGLFGALIKPGRRRVEAHEIELAVARQIKELLAL